MSGPSGLFATPHHAKDPQTAQQQRQTRRQRDGWQHVFCDACILNLRLREVVKAKRAIGERATVGRRRITDFENAVDKDLDEVVGEGQIEVALLQIVPAGRPKVGSARHFVDRCGVVPPTACAGAAGAFRCRIAEIGWIAVSRLDHRLVSCPNSPRSGAFLP